jgi:hypothetical protein
MSKYCAKDALRMFMLEGNPITTLEAMLLFGARNPTAEIYRFREKGFIIKKQRIPMIKVFARLSKFTACQPPPDLPVREILMTEYWIQS